MKIHRREVLISIGGALAAATLGKPLLGRAASAAKPVRLGICSDSYGIRRRQTGDGSQAGERLNEPLGFLAFCHERGAGGIQLEIGAREAAYTTRLRRQAEDWDMFVEASIGLPRGQADVERFAAEVVACQNAGVKVLRTVLASQGSGRRYEAYDSGDDFQKARKRGLQALQWAEPVVARSKVRLAVENHKDEFVHERLETLKSISSEYVGACVDTGNDLSFLEDPMAVVEAYAPWAFSVHLKDMAVQQYDDGFLLAEVPLGEGILDLAKMVSVLRGHHPEVRFSLEMITRDALKIPCLTDRYWQAMGDVPAGNLARTLRLVRTAGRKEPLPSVGQLPLAQQMELEDVNVKKCLVCAAGLVG
jgi:sugar phosphate isomerase/epimerase